MKKLKNDINELLFKIKYKSYDYIDGLYGKWIKKDFGENSFTNESIDLLKEISKEAYPSTFYDEYNYITTTEEASIHFGCKISQLEFLCDKNYYMVIIHHFDKIEIVDFAARGGRCTEILKIANHFIKNYSGRRICVRARESTSYPLLQLLGKKKKINIVSDTLAEYFGEQFHNMIFYIN